jgi:leader peptidase (prepilin peptidase)/N-methyltransferase
MLSFILFIFGAVVGSFLNVLIDRLPAGKNPWIGRSHCDHCKHVLHAADLFPIASYVLLSGKCRYCRKKISSQNPLIEIISGTLFVITFWFSLHHGALSSDLNHVLITTGLLFSIFATFLVIFVVDLKHRIIPDEMTILAGFLSLVYVLFNSNGNYSMILNAVIGGLISGIFFAALYLVTRGRGIGFGDVKLAPVLGLFLGFPLVVVGLYITFLTGGVIACILLLGRKKKWGQKIAFGPFLIWGTVVAYFCGQSIINWYLSLFKL